MADVISATPSGRLRRSPRSWVTDTLAADVPRLGHIPQFDGIRGILVFPVMWVHYSFSDFGGQLVIDCFFAMSGFLITTLLLEEHDRSGRISIRAFYERRAVRLVPELVACLAVQVALAVAGVFPLRSTLVEAFGVFFYIYPLVGGFVSDPHQLRMSHYWSLTWEEWYYAIWAPVAAAFLVRGKRTGPTLWVAAVAVSLVSLVLRGLAWRQFGPTPLLGLRWEALVLGSCAALARRDLLVGRAQGTPRAWDRMLYAATPAFLATIAIAWIFEPTRWYVWPIGMFLTSFSVIAMSCDRETRPIQLLYTNPVSRKIGAACYAIYIWHLVPFVLINGESAFVDRRQSHPWWVTIPSATLITVAIGMASTAWIAEPARRAYSARRLRRAQPATAPT